MKKLIALLLAALMLLSLAGCTEAPASSDALASSDTPASSDEPDAPADPVTVQLYKMDNNLRIDEEEPLEPILIEWANRNNMVLDYISLGADQAEADQKMSVMMLFFHKAHLICRTVRSILLLLARGFLQ